ncbi:MAG: class I SAM-dependent methyltransferase [Chlamydiota bacterium]|nr:class I SAM-dependent methyltransferase [Chlamydiota bacterium]
MNQAQTSTQCPLCSSDDFISFHHNNKRNYLKCHQCKLVFLTPSEHPSPEEDKARYLKHENNPTDEGYRTFLKRLSSCIIPKLRQNSFGLDFGAGYAPTLSLIMREEGFLMEDYDLHFSPNTTCLQKQYDFISCCETIEHFYHPIKEFEQFDVLLKKGAWLGIMTEMLENETGFHKWWYPHDLTHVAFYQKETFFWISERFNWAIEFPRKNVALFQKN